MCQREGKMDFYEEIVKPFARAVDWANHYGRMLLLPVLIVIGIYGALLTIKICIGLRKWESTCKMYFLTMSMGDLLFLLSFAVPSFTSMGIQYWTEGAFEFSPQLISSFYCKVIAYVVHVSAPIPYWVLVAYSIERLVSICFPFQRDRWITMKTAKCACISIISLAVIGYSPILFTDVYYLEREKHPIRNRECAFQPQNESVPIKIWFVVTTVFLSIICGPILLMLVNLLLFLKLRSFIKDSNHFTFKPENVDAVIPSSEIKNAKSVLILSIITVAMVLPMLSWGVYSIIEGNIST